MEIKWLEDFISLARSHSFSRSAAERNITQPAFSRRIRALERWLGMPLVDRSTYPTTLTRAGKEFLETAEQTLRLLYEARDHLRGDWRRGNETLLFTATHSIALDFFPVWLHEVEFALGVKSSRMIAGNLHDCVQNLTEGESDFLICYTHPQVPLLLDAEHYPSLLLGHDELIPVSAPDAQGNPIYPLPGAVDTPLSYMAYAANSFLGRCVDLLLAQPPQPCWLVRYYENALAEAIKAMIMARHGMAWLPHNSVRHNLVRGELVRAGSSDWNIPLRLMLYRSVEKTSPAVESLWQFLLEKTKK